MFIPVTASVSAVVVPTTASTSTSRPPAGGVTISFSISTTRPSSVPVMVSISATASRSTRPAGVPWIAAVSLLLPSFALRELCSFSLHTRLTLGVCSLTWNHQRSFERSCFPTKSQLPWFPLSTKTTSQPTGNPSWYSALIFKVHKQLSAIQFHSIAISLCSKSLVLIFIFNECIAFRETSHNITYEVQAMYPSIPGECFPYSTFFCSMIQVAYKDSVCRVSTNSLVGFVFGIHCPDDSPIMWFIICPIYTACCQGVIDTLHCTPFSWCWPVHLVGSSSLVLCRKHPGIWNKMHVSETEVQHGMISLHLHIQCSGLHYRLQFECGILRPNISLYNFRCVQEPTTFQVLTPKYRRNRTRFCSTQVESTLQRTKL